MASNMTVGDVRDKLAEAINRVAFGGERIRLRRHGKAVVAMVPIEDLEMIEHCEDQHWIKEGRKAEKDVRRRGERAISWDQAKRNLDGAKARKGRQRRKKSA
jgi:antitoxin (DNA-binding transcriptional repressor) of toxin-antitoxin stability system